MLIIKPVGEGPCREVHIKVLLPPKEYCSVKRPLRAGPGEWEERDEGLLDIFSFLMPQL